MRVMHTAPFRSRAYGGFSSAQVRFIEATLGSPRDKKVVDPMCGQAYHAATWAAAGARITAGDINPGPLALATLRDPRAIRRHAEYAASFGELINDTFPGSSRRRRLNSSAWSETREWLSQASSRDLLALGQRVGITERSDLAKVFAVREGLARFSLGITALAARRFATFRLSDNLTWLRPGGVPSDVSVPEALAEALEEWVSWCRTLREVPSTRGVLQTRLSSVLDLANERKLQNDADYVITSPPYANRLDYRRMWAPETAAVLALCGAQIDEVRGFLGSNEVLRPVEADLAGLPRSVKSALKSIREHPSWGSAHYYHPFFARYAVEIHRAFSRVGGLVKQGGLAIVIGRDTVRKDTLFPTVDIVIHAMRATGMTVVKKQGEIIRSHVGNLRRVSDVGLFGKAQREWWLVLRRD